jgi:hypothetical protein
MDTVYEDCVRAFADGLREMLPLMAQLDVERCLAEVRGMPVLKRVEWCLRARCPLRLCVGVGSKLEMAPGIFAPDEACHTVLCLTSDLLARLPGAVHKLPLPDAPGAALGIASHPLQRMKVVHMALYRAELDQDYDLGLALAPGG